MYNKLRVFFHLFTRTTNKWEKFNERRSKKELRVSLRAVRRAHFISIASRAFVPSLRREKLLPSLVPTRREMRKKKREKNQRKGKVLCVLFNTMYGVRLPIVYAIANTVEVVHPRSTFFILYFCPIIRSYLLPPFSVSFGEKRQKKNRIKLRIVVPTMIPPSVCPCFACSRITTM